MSPSLSPTTSTEITTTRIPLPAELFTHYEAQAMLAGVEIEEYIVAHLGRTREFIDHAPIYLNDRLSTEVRKLVGGGATSTPERLVEMIRRLCSWKVGGYRLELPPPVQEQISSYARSLGKSIDEVAPELLLNAVRGYFRA